MVIGADSVVIDLGRSVRLFTGLARLAAQLANTECFWPGCHVPVSQCQIDHLVPFTERDDGGGGGRTNPGNGGPACGKHNRHEEHGSTVWRDPTGRWHTHRRRHRNRRAPAECEEITIRHTRPHRKATSSAGSIVA